MPATASDLESGATAYRRLIQLVGLQALLAVTAQVLGSAVAGDATLTLVVAAVFLAMALGALIAGAVTAYTLARHADIGAAWLWPLALLVPGLSLVALLYLHLRARQWCHGHRIETGLLGPTRRALERLRAAARVPRRSLGDRLVTAMGAVAAVALILAVPAHAYLRPAIERRLLADELRGEYTRLTALSPEAARVFFDETHAACLEKGALDAKSQAGCLDAAFEQRLGRVLLLEAPQWEPHPDPAWAKLSFAMRALDGAVPQGPTTLTDLECGDDRPFRMERAAEVAGDRASVLVPRKPGPCRLKVSIKDGRWSLGQPLALETPAPTPVPLDPLGSTGGVTGAMGISDPTTAGQGLPHPLVDPLLRDPEVAFLGWEWLTPGRELKVRVRAPGLASLADYLGRIRKLPECEYAEPVALPEGRPIEAELTIRLRAS
jgi:hypothetical protein